ncbi:MAG TPA: metallophosphoesterase family protein [Alphaproteobacteria bacterium]|nr:metallophosphoesterase family protein [Alphaproteobacteria bacterium]
MRLDLARLAYRPHVGPPEQIHLSWSDDPATSLTVRWVAPGPGEGLVEYRTSGSSWRGVSSHSIPSPGIGGLLHTAQLHGLSASTQYEYRVIIRTPKGDLTSPVFVTGTAPWGQAETFTFGFFCDTGVVARPGGKVDGLQRILQELRQARPLLLLGGGDYAYCDKDPRFKAIAPGIDAWFRQMQPLLAEIPLMAQYGNHEVDLVERFSDWEPRFSHPLGRQGKCYSFKIGAAHFAAFYAPLKTLDPKDVAWLDENLAAARAAGARWLIVYQHQPIFAHGHSHPASPEVQNRLIPVLDRHRVDLHLSGHDQNFERTFPLRGATAVPSIASRDPNTTPAGVGTIYAKISPSGKRSDIGGDFSRFTGGQQEFIAARDDSAHHYALITVGPMRLEVAVQSVPNDSEPSSTIDRFAIVQEAGPRP